ncbi:Lrp/AsnC family transcriptional regulator [Amycolatopsis sp. H20-H5]|uniref:Lrp/AsnC family transcriptional regulator n=1 Tax=Amycolatopsis sp. H20-H5 TaxID=3046309 RepID=UPI002DBD14A3|nr:Lrp/AsnC family transcriptional regulator [Amycolatopsis sp. H20-H5]MEC3979683.1 Lrp/AsnC family transcriptional regulator [Amycolatopsis sp. H20-H5]
MSDTLTSGNDSADQTSGTASLPAGSPGRTVAPLDEVDRAIIGELSEDGRMSIRSLADKLHISRTNAYARIERLLAEHVITGFGLRVDARLAGLGTSAYIMVTVEQTSWRAMAAGLRKIPYVDHVALVGGDFDILLLVRTPDNATLRDVVLERLQAIEGVRSTRTWLIFEELDGIGPPWLS